MKSLINELNRLSLIKLFALAILLRVLLMPFFFHPDIKTYNFQAQFLKNGVWNIYSYLLENKQSLPLKEEFVYFPLTYYFLGGYQIIASPLLGSDFNNWLNNASVGESQAQNIFRYLFVLKLPYLLLDILIAFLFLKLFNSDKTKKAGFVFWLFNPFSLILIYIFGNLDVIVVMITVLSLLLVKRNKLVFAALCLGLGSAFKAYPMLFLPFLLLVGNSISERLKILVAGLGSFLVIIVPFVIKPGFSQAALVSGLTTRIISSGLSIGFGETLIFPIISLAALFAYALSKGVLEKEQLWKYYLSVLLLVISSIHFHIQWLLWLVPFVVILLVKSQKYITFIWLIGLIALAIPILYEDKFMSVSLYSVISPLFSLLPIPFGAVQKLYDPYAVQSVLQSGLVGMSLILIWQILKGEEYETG
ncbi:hypothetical protein M1563_02305 [Patescibacteria group bacterium]|nr:hypothetical protein [Patescibacteria group bacterium]MCL5409615.1 hypothetical protein [Patescibacteria group bacterium]